LTQDRKWVQVQPGLALDKAGREIVVPALSDKILVPNSGPPPKVEGAADKGAEPAAKCEEDERETASLWICWKECPVDPEPVTAPPCGAPPVCSSGSIKEWYHLEIRPCCAPEIDLNPEIPGAFLGGRVNYSDLVQFVTAPCRPVPCDACIPLANLRLPFEGQLIEEADIDITVRPIVYSNDLLFEMVLGLMAANQSRPRGGKN
jgi:hypothetical protein